MREENIIEVRNLTHFYGRKKIYENLNFNVKKGNVVGLLGKNGAGKSTTINILMGFLRPHFGSCKIYGQDADRLMPEAKAKIGLLYEGHVCYDYLTIEQIERLHAAHYGKIWKKELYYGKNGSQRKAAHIHAFVRSALASSTGANFCARSADTNTLTITLPG